MLSVKVDIVESAEELSQLLEQEKDQLRFQKLRTLYLLKTQKVKTLRHIAQILGRHRSTIGLWVKAYREGGLEKLLENRNTSSFSDVPTVVVKYLQKKIQDLRFVPSTKEAQKWLKQELGFEIEGDKLYKLLKREVIPTWEAARAQETGEFIQKTTIDVVLKHQISATVYEKLEQWKDERGFPNNSQAIEHLIGEFFGKRAKHAIKPLQQPGINLIESIVQRALKIAIPYHIPDLLSQNRLSERLGIHNSILCRNRSNRNFAGWTQRQDPDGVGWQWVPALKKYKPLLSSEEIRSKLLQRSNDKDGADSNGFSG